MIFKKKTEIEVEVTDTDIEMEKLRAKVEMYKTRYESLLSDLTLQKISDVDFAKEEKEIMDEVEEDINRYGFDDLMGKPMEWMEDLFHGDL